MDVGSVTTPDVARVQIYSLDQSSAGPHRLLWIGVRPAQHRRVDRDVRPLPNFRAHYYRSLVESRRCRRLGGPQQQLGSRWAARPSRLPDRHRQGMQHDHATTNSGGVACESYHARSSVRSNWIPPASPGRTRSEYSARGVRSVALRAAAGIEEIPS